jgi:hypothetical protein
MTRMRVAMVAGVALWLAACSGDQSAPGDDGGGGGDAGAPGDFAQSGGDLATVYAPVTINFDDLVVGTNVTNQYAAHATFSSDPGCYCQVRNDAGLAASQPNYCMTFYSCANGATASVFLDFAKPVRGLSFKGIGVNNTGKVATINIVTAAGKQSMDMVGMGNALKPLPVDLSSYSGVTRLEIVNINDLQGMGFDDFGFQFPQP